MKYLRNYYLLKQLQNALKLFYTLEYYALAITKTIAQEREIRAPPCTQYLRIILPLLDQSDTENCCSKFLLASLVELSLLAVV